MLLSTQPVFVSVSVSSLFNLHTTKTPLDMHVLSATYGQVSPPFVLFQQLFFIPQNRQSRLVQVLPINLLDTPRK